MDSSEEDNTDVDVEEFLKNLSFQPTFSNAKTDKRPESHGGMPLMVFDSEEEEDGKEEERKSVSDLVQSLNTSSADTVLLSQNSSQSELEVDEKAMPEDTQIMDQSGNPSPDQRDQNCNAKENSGASYWLNELLNSKSKKLDIEDISFPSTSSPSQRDEPAPEPSSTKAGKRKRSRSAEEIPGSSTPSSVPSRSKRTKKEQPQGTCPLCDRSMKLTVLERHAGEAVTDCCFLFLQFIFL